MPGSIRDVRAGSRLLAEGTDLQAESGPRSLYLEGFYSVLASSICKKIQVNFKIFFFKKRNF